MICTLCPRNCQVDREDKLGVCGAKAGALLSRAELHFWEEPYLCGNGASGAVFFSGCNLKCVYCQNEKISFHAVGDYLSPSELADKFKFLEDEGAENIDLITPTPFVPWIKQALDIYRPNLPIIYNCGGYENAETIRSLKGYIDIYLPDYKYFDNELAKRYSGAPDYRERCEESIMEMRSQVQDVVTDDVMKQGLAIRHLVLPTHIKNTFAVLDRINTLLGNQTFVSLMSQYLPCGHIEKYPELNKKVSTLEYKAAVAHAEKLGFDNCFIQEGSAATADFIPAFLK